MSIYDTTVKYAEPQHGENSGTMVVERQPSAYERYMREQGIPVYEAAGFHDVRELDLKPWDRLGGNGAFLVPDNTIDLMGMHVLEIPPGKALNPERHLYEEKFWVIEGEGTTELWLEGSSQRQRFEWHAGSLFAVPINVNYQLINARSSRVLILVGNTAPPLLNIFENEGFIFGNDFKFRERYNETEDYYAPVTETVATPELGRAAWTTNIIPDIVDCELPLDNQRSPGYRRIEPWMARGNFWCFIGEHVPGHYSKAHAHGSGAVLICVKGEGYTYNWPVGAGTTPWQDGHSDAVEYVDYVSGGFVAAAPGGGDWYHQHFGSSAEPLRLLVFFGGLPQTYSGYGGRSRNNTWGNANIEDGGRSINYKNEDPFIRAEYERMLSKHGLNSQMSPALYV